MVRGRERGLEEKKLPEKQRELEQRISSGIALTSETMYNKTEESFIKSGRWDDRHASALIQAYVRPVVKQISAAEMPDALKIKTYKRILDFILSPPITGEHQVFKERYRYFRQKTADMLISLTKKDVKAELLTYMKETHPEVTPVESRKSRLSKFLGGNREP